MGNEGGPEDPWTIVRSLPMGTRVEVTDGRGGTWTGSVVPHHEFSGERILQLKLPSGYNVGIRVGPDFAVRILAEEASGRPGDAAPRPASPPGDGRYVALLTTGGTIASRVDYETGGVRPVKGEEEILNFYPELEDGGRVKVVHVFDRLSEDLSPEDWSVLAGTTVDAFRQGAAGVVIAHGTDTLGFSAAALSFVLADLPGPVVLVGSQRSPDRPSSDGPGNLRAAMAVARDARVGEVVVVMQSGLSDDRFAVHRGNWVRKMHSSRRDAFESRNGPPLGVVQDGRLELLQPARPPTKGPARVDGEFETRTGLLWFYPGLAPDRARVFAQGLRGVVLAGTGLGHVSSGHLPWIRAAVEEGVLVAMTTQCLAGRVDPYVYSTGRALEKAGVLYLDDLLPETAYAKLAWALGHARSAPTARRLLLEPRAGEFLPRHPGAASP